MENDDATDARVTKVDNATRRCASRIAVDEHTAVAAQNGWRSWRSKTESGTHRPCDESVEP